MSVAVCCSLEARMARGAVPLLACGTHNHSGGKEGSGVVHSSKWAGTFEQVGRHQAVQVARL